MVLFRVAKHRRAGAARSKEELVLCVKALEKDRQILDAIPVTLYITRLLMQVGKEEVFRGCFIQRLGGWVEKKYTRILMFYFCAEKPALSKLEGGAGAKPASRNSFSRTHSCGSPFAGFLRPSSV